MPPARKTSARSTRPDDKPFDFDLDTVEGEVDCTPWVMNWKGRGWTFAHFENLDVWEQAKASDLGSTAATMKVFELALGKDVWVEFQKIPLPTRKLKALWEAYAEHCGIDLGESPDSEPS